MTVVLTVDLKVELLVERLVASTAGQRDTLSVVMLVV